MAVLRGVVGRVGDGHCSHEVECIAGRIPTVWEADGNIGEHDYLTPRTALLIHLIKEEKMLLIMAMSLAMAALCQQ